jgi:Domain of unknown function (DUF929)
VTDAGAPSTGEDMVDPAEAEAPGSTRAARFAWGAVVVLLLGFVALVTYALTRTAAPANVARPSVTSDDIVATLAGVSASTFDSVGVTVPGTTLTQPAILHGQPPLSRGGRPEVLFVGSEYCPFCAAERWPLVVALDRFGRFSTLHNTQSAPFSVFSGIQSFSFVDTTYTSRYVILTGVELYSDQAGPDGTFARISHLDPGEAALVARYTPLVDGTGAPGTWPFVDIANRMVTATSGFSPALLVSQSQAQIAGEVAQPLAATSQTTTPVPPSGQAIIAAANELSAGICLATGGQPAAVCGSKAVRSADQALGLG